MNSSRSWESTGRLIGAAVCALFTSGCMHWTAQGKPTPEVIRQLETQQVPARLRVTLLSGERITYKSARVVGDSLRDGGLSFVFLLKQSGFHAFGRGGRPIAKTNVGRVEFWKITQQGPLWHRWHRWRSWPIPCTPCRASLFSECAGKRLLTGGDFVPKVGRIFRHVCQLPRDSRHPLAYPVVGQVGG